MATTSTTSAIIGVITRSVAIVSRVGNKLAHIWVHLFRASSSIFDNRLISVIAGAATAIVAPIVPIGGAFLISCTTTTVV